jgi:hypothetical protein
MDQKSVWMVNGEELAELLDGPVGGWMSGDVGVQNAAGVDLHGDEYVQYPESRGDRHEEIAGDHSFRVVAHECGPSLIAVCAAGPGGVEIFRNGAGCDMDAELE